MKTISGKVHSLKPISLSKAASTLSAFISTDSGASQSLCAYLRRGSDSFNELKQLHKELRVSRSDAEHKRLKSGDIRGGGDIGDNPSRSAVSQEFNHRDDNTKKKRSSQVGKKDLNNQSKGEGRSFIEEGLHQIIGNGPRRASSSSHESTDVNDKLSSAPVSAQIQKDKAQLTVVNAMSSVLKDYDAHKEPKHMYKHRLQHYSLKTNLKFPVYSCEREGPSHASRFKCDVTIDRKACTSDDFFSTIKDAENEVARIALGSLSQFGAQELIQDDYSCYKNLLQELSQKRKSNFPIYKIEKSGESHIPKFISTVEFEGEIFTGQASKTKKQAEMSVAEIAYHAKRKQSVHNLQLNMTNEQQESIKPSAFLNLNSFLSTPKQGLDCSPAGDGDSNFNCGGIQDALVSSSTVPLCHLSSDREGTPSKRICIFPHMANVTYPEGDGVLPMSDDKWVALSLSGNQNYSANVLDLYRYAVLVLVNMIDSCKQIMCFLV